MLRRDTERITHEYFTDLLHHLQRDDVLVLNNSRVLPARLRGAKAVTGGAVELLLFEENNINDWWVLLRPGKRVRPGALLAFHVCLAAQAA